jgi:hypothetical protein
MVVRSFDRFGPAAIAAARPTSGTGDVPPTRLPTV